MLMRKKIFMFLMTSIILLMILGIASMDFIEKRDESISLINDEKIIEYGSSYHPTINELIDLAEYDFIDVEKVVIETNLKNEENKEYPAVGDYEVNINYKNVGLKQTVKVKDTIAPELSIKDNIEIPFGTDLETYDFTESISVSDLSNVNRYELDTNNVNVVSSGEYVAKVSVSDIYSNESEKEFKITVGEQEKKELPKEEPVIDNSSNSQKKNVAQKVSNKSQAQEKTNNGTTTSISSSDNPVEESSVQTNSQPEENKIQESSNQQVSDNTPSLSTANTEPVVHNEPTPSDLEYWCVSGGNHHVFGDGADEHGYYNSWGEAEQAFQSYTAGWPSLQYKIQQCACGKYYFWAIQN